jgi:hypothetical protein
MHMALLLSCFPFGPTKIGQYDETTISVRPSTVKNEQKPPKS